MEETHTTAESDSLQRLTRVEAGLGALSAAVEKLAQEFGQENRTTNRAIAELSKLVHDQFQRQGRPDWKAMAAWASIVFTLLSGAIGATTYFSSREIARINADAVEHEKWAAIRSQEISERIDEHSRSIARLMEGRGRVETQIFALSSRTNLYRDESNRMVQIMADKLGTRIPPPSYYPPEFGSDEIVPNGHK